MSNDKSENKSENKSKLVQVEFLTLSAPYNAGDIAWFRADIAKQYVDKKLAKYVNRKHARERLAEHEAINYHKADWLRVQTVTKELTGKEPLTKAEAVKYLDLEEI